MELTAAWDIILGSPGVICKDGGHRAEYTLQSIYDRVLFSPENSENEFRFQNGLFSAIQKWKDGKRIFYWDHLLGIKLDIPNDEVALIRDFVERPEFLNECYEWRNENLRRAGGDDT